MNRKELQELAEIRIKEAEILLKSECYDGAYYMAGYSIGCALKAWIAKSTKEHDFPDKKIADKVHTHDLVRLLGVLDVQVPEEIKFNWFIVKDWSEKARYEKYSMVEASDLLAAINDPTEGD
ncbi:HEPN domain-containing protein [Caldifermentibacillus hisashii]|uniref:HEPN domain-containing protein n=1 Tax=Caldifermentibacillus hisashii TaxID=996558 RepID=UPI0034D78221